MHVMLSCVREELMSMRSGLLDIIPSELLIGLTAEVDKMMQYVYYLSNLSLSLYRISSFFYPVILQTYHFRGSSLS